MGGSVFAGICPHKKAGFFTAHTFGKMLTLLTERTIDLVDHGIFFRV